MKALLKSLLVATAIGVAGLTGAQALAHDSGGWGGGMGPGMGSGMMMGPGMMGSPNSGMGYGHGMMMGNQGNGMMGGYGMPCQGASANTSGKELTTADVQKNLERHLAWMGNDRLKVGKVTTKDGKIIAEVVTKDGSLVDRMAIDPKTGVMQRTE